jgi:hypothetical protein
MTTQSKGKIMASYLLKKIKEPSTWAGLSIIAAAFGMPPGTFELLAQLGIAAGGLVSIVLNEAGS